VAAPRGASTQVKQIVAADRQRAAAFVRRVDNAAAKKEESGGP